MKYATTRKAVLNGYPVTISVPYCALQTLLCRSNPVAYTSGKYGWGADVYDFGPVAIVTGYAPFGTVRPDYDLIKRYEDQAEAIINRRWTDDDRKPLAELLRAFISEVSR